MIDFVDKSLLILSDLGFSKIIITVTENEKCRDINEKDFYKMHIQDTMERIEMELQNKNDNLCVLFVDPVSEEKNKLFRTMYFELYQSDDFIEKYSHIKDCLNFEPSHQSFGIQLADYISGCFLGFLKGYPDSRTLFNTRIKPYLRRGDNEEILGYGIKEIPKDDKVRENIMRKLDAYK